ncbi:MAG: ABC transporter permease [Deltaproteobacteria bacterium]|nr:ABC transporter permease [Deltaproteobacteria bacterium]
MTGIWSALAMAVTELRRNLTRTLLTSLGILIGVAAVIVMVGVGRGATASIEGDLASMGSNLIFLVPGTDGGPRDHSVPVPFELADVYALQQQVPYLSAVAPLSTTSVTATLGGVDWKTTVDGTTNAYLLAMARELEEGRLFTEGELRSGAGVCMLGATVKEELFAGMDPIGSAIRLGKMSCTVVGVLEAKGANTMGMDQDNMVIAPLAAVQRRLLGNTSVSMILLSVDSEAHMNKVKRAVDEVMRQRRHVTGDATVDFSVHDTAEMATMVSGVTTILTAFLAAVAGISLLVGGIGIMNIMLVSVTERTREIGVRMAIGALERDVMTQFLIEAVVLSMFGGVMGILLGLGGTALISALVGVPFVVDPLIVGLAVSFSAGMGVAFGWFPARRAARMEPIEALRR